MLSALPPARIAALAADEEFLGRLHEAERDLREYMSGPRWYAEPDQGLAGPQGRPTRGRCGPAAIAYFSPEYGITAALPQYSGGLGILAGDHLKSASDLGVPLIGGRPALPARVLHPVAVRRRLAGRALPRRRPERPAARAAPRRRRRPGARHGRPARGHGSCPPRSGWPRSAGSRCCCSTPTWRRTRPTCTRSPTGCTAAAATTGSARNCCSASAACGRCAPSAR